MTLVEHEQAEDRKVSAALAIGILLMPLVFVWFTLRKGHSTLSRILSFLWLIVAFVLSFTLNAYEQSQKPHDIWEDKVGFKVDLRGGGCKDPMPIAVTITNNSDVDMLEYGWWISAKAKGHSTELTVDNGNSTSDYILKAGHGVTFCNAIPALRSNEYQESELEFNPGGVFVYNPREKQ
jgi:hypothetical protein